MSETGEKPEEKAPWWKRATWFFGAIGAGAMIGLCTLFYNIGKDVGERGGREQVETAKAAGETLVARCERAGAKVEEDLRQCGQSNASLQAVLRLNEADRTKILDATVVVPSLRITIDGTPLAGRVPLKSAMLPTPDGGLEGRCFESRLWLENTSSRDVRIDGIEAVIDQRWGGDGEWDSVVAENDPTKMRHWTGGAEPNLPPGSRRYIPFNFCTGHHADEMEVSLAVFASGYLPMRVRWTAIPR